MGQQTIKDVQNKILETMLFIDKLCREYEITYYIMGGTALGAIRHGGFIPWDDDLDIFMTPENYRKFKTIFNKIESEKYVLQEWNIHKNHLQYAKIRMNGTTFIEEAFKNRKDLHHGIYVDIMILHKCPTNKFIQKVIYYESKYLTLVALSERNWKPKNITQKLTSNILKYLPNKILVSLMHNHIYKYEDLKTDFSYCYFITKANFNQGIFNKEIFELPIDIPFEEVYLKGPTDIKKYLELRYGDYMELPSLEQQKLAIHAEIYDTEEGFEKYIF